MRVFFTLFLLSISLNVFAQNGDFPFGKTTHDELGMKTSIEIHTSKTIN
jgi:hypothetical protein